MSLTPLSLVLTGKLIQNFYRIKILEGKAFSEEEKGIMLSSKITKDARIGVGDFVEIIIPDGMSVAIRSLPVTAIYDYPMYTQVLERLVLVNARTIREMTDVANTFLIDSDFIHADNTALLNRANEDFESFDDLFDDLFLMRAL